MLVGPCSVTNYVCYMTNSAMQSCMWFRSPVQWGFSSFLPKIRETDRGGQVMTSLSWVIGVQVATGWGACTVRVGFTAGVSEVWLVRREDARDSGTRPEAQMQEWGNHCWHAAKSGAPTFCSQYHGPLLCRSTGLLYMPPVTFEGRELFQKPQRAVFLVRAVQISFAT